MTHGLSTLLANIRKLSEIHKAHIEVKDGDDVYIYEDGERLWSEAVDGEF